MNLSIMKIIPKIEMKPCPFCGEIPEDFFVTLGYNWCSVQCTCGVKGPQVPMHCDESCFDDAAIGWNKRYEENKIK